MVGCEGPAEAPGRRVAEGVYAGSGPAGRRGDRRQRRVVGRIIGATRARNDRCGGRGSSWRRSRRRVGVSEDAARVWRARWAAATEALVAAEAEGDDRVLEAVVVRVLADESRSGRRPVLHWSSPARSWRWPARCQPRPPGGASSRGRAAPARRRARARSAHPVGRTGTPRRAGAPGTP
jgi:hypothetical protein